MKNKIAYKFCYDFNTFTGLDVESVIDLFNESVGIRFSKFVSPSLGCYDIERIDQRHARDIAGISESIRITLFNDSEEVSLNFVNPAHRNSCQSITILMPESIPFTSELKKYFVLDKMLTVGYVYDYDFARWQSEVHPQNYRSFGVSLNDAKVYWNDFFSEEQIDVSGNPGRMTFVSRMWLTAAPIMYYGKKMFEFIPKSIIQQSEIPVSVASLNENVEEIVLFTDILNSKREDNYDKLKLFRQLIKLDQIEAKLK